MTFQRLVDRAQSYSLLGSRPRGFQLADLRQYLDEGGNPDEKDGNGLSLLHQLADSGDAPAVELLISRGAALNTQDAQGWTPLHFAVDADCDSANQDRNRPLALTTTQKLIESGADESIRSLKGETARDIAVAYGKLATAHYDAIPRPHNTIPLK